MISLWKRERVWFTFPRSYLLCVFAEVVMHFHATVLSFTHICIFVLWYLFSIYVPCLCSSAQLLICCLSRKVTQCKWKNVAFKGSILTKSHSVIDNRCLQPFSELPRNEKSPLFTSCPCSTFAVRACTSLKTSPKPLTPHLNAACWRQLCCDFYSPSLFWMRRTARASTIHLKGPR